MFAVVIELNLGQDAYGHLSADVVSTLQTFSQMFTESTVIVETNEEESNSTITVIHIYYVSSTGAPDNQATMELFHHLTISRANVMEAFPQIAENVSEASSANNPTSIINPCMKS